MKKILLIVSVLLISALAVTGCKKKAEEAAAPVEKPKFVLGLDDSFPPMGFRDENNNIVGFDIDLAKEVTNRMGYELVLQPIDWASKELELNNGKVDAVWNGLSVDPVRAETMSLTKPYLANNMIIMVSSSSDIKSKADLEKGNKTIGIQMGSTAVKALDADPLSKVTKKAEYENNVLALADLKLKRVDAVVLDEVVARYLSSKDTASFTILSDNLGSEVYAIAFKNGNEALKAKVEQALDAMKADGTADKIAVEWFGAPVVLK